MLYSGYVERWAAPPGGGDAAAPTDLEGPARRGAAAGRGSGGAGGAAGGPARLAVPPSWWEALFGRCAAVLPSLNGQDTSMLLWAVVALQAHQESQQQQHLQQQQQQQQQQGRAGWVEGSGDQVGGASASRPPPPHAPPRGRPRPAPLPPPGFVRALLDVTQPWLPRFGPQALSGTVWALARLRVLPSRAWLDAFVHSSTLAMAAPHPEQQQQQQQQRGRQAQGQAGPEPEALANMAWALAVMEASPPAAWLSAFVRSSVACAPRAEPPSLARMLWAAARLPGFQPPRGWVAALLRAMPPARMAQRGASPQDLANMLWAVAALRYPPPAAWIEGVLHIMVVWCETGRPPPPPALMPPSADPAADAAGAGAAAPQQQQLRRAGGGGSSAAPPQSLEIAACLVALAQLRYRPAGATLGRLAAALLPALGAGGGGGGGGGPRGAAGPDPQALCNALWALAVLRAPPTPQWMQVRRGTCVACVGARSSSVVARPLQTVSTV